uniref:Transmembrane protein n=1 Tax=Neospora caninum (strain Liverpool) TaxID=572307 RepID=A0A0F7UEK4_NEOCL|nr:TPA: hypothetical protein BN1204_040700 [Neospora caninum Liverpool]
MPHRSVVSCFSFFLFELPRTRSAPAAAPPRLLLFCLFCLFPVSPVFFYLSFSPALWPATVSHQPAHTFTYALTFPGKHDIRTSTRLFRPFGGVGYSLRVLNLRREKPTLSSGPFLPLQSKQNPSLAFLNTTAFGYAPQWYPHFPSENEQTQSSFSSIFASLPSSPFVSFSFFSSSPSISSSTTSSFSFPSAYRLRPGLSPLLCSLPASLGACGDWRLNREEGQAFSFAWPSFVAPFFPHRSPARPLRRSSFCRLFSAYAARDGPRKSGLFFLPVPPPLSADVRRPAYRDIPPHASLQGVRTAGEQRNARLSSRLKLWGIPAQRTETEWPAGAAPPPGIRAPRWTVDTDGNFKILEQHGPPQDERLVGWEDVLMEEQRSWNATGKTEAQILRGEKTLTYAEKFQQRIFEARKIPHFQFVHHQPRGRPALWIVRPKQGTKESPHPGNKRKKIDNCSPVYPSVCLCALDCVSGAYCELMKDDNPRVHALVSRIRSRYDRNALDIYNITLTADMPLCEVFFVGPIPELGRIFYARGGTLQYRVRPRFRTRCPTLAKDERLVQKYGGDGCPGLFPEWDEDGIMEELDECLNQPPPESECYPANLEWDNLAAFTPENVEERPYWYTHVHWPTRVAVQRAFEAGIADFRDVIEKEYEQLIAEDRQRARQLQYQQEHDDRVRRGDSNFAN